MNDQNCSLLRKITLGCSVALFLVSIEGHKDTELYISFILFSAYGIMEHIKRYSK